MSYEKKKQVAAAALAEIDPTKPYGTELFNAIARVSINVAVEAVCLRRGDSGVEVLMTRRAEDDTAYPGEWHCPGSFFRPGEDETQVFARLAKGEFLADGVRWQFASYFNSHQEERGHTFSLIFLCELEEGVTPHRGQWWPVDRLPERAVYHHRHNIITVAVKAFGVKIVQ